MGWDSSRPVPWQRLMREWVIYVGIMALVLAVFPSLLEWITEALGFEVPANLLLFGTSVVLVLVAVQLSYELSSHEAKIRRLAEEVALQNEEIKRLRSDIEGA